MTDTDRTPSPDRSTEPLSSPAPATRGPSLWNRLRSILALRTVSLRDDLQVALDGQASMEVADFSESERAILQNVLKLSDVRVEDVMVERSDIHAVAADTTLGALIARFREVGHSRLPVYSESLDDILGFIHVKDALRRITEPVARVAEPEEGTRDLPIRLISAALRQKIGKLDILREAVFVPPSMPVGDLLQSMRTSHVHMAVVVDEYGGTDGLVTIEDLLEAVVGEIEDEHDEASQALVRKVGADTFVADARAELEEVQRMLGPEFDPGEYAEDVDTIGGLLFDIAGRVPQKGEHVTELKGFDFQILAADSRRIKKLRIRRLRPRPSAPGSSGPATLPPGADQIQPTETTAAE